MLMSLHFNVESMELCISLKWKLMEELQNIQLIKQVQNMELDIVMLNALTMLNSSMAKLIPRIGKQAKVIMVHVVQNSIFGKLINMLTLILFILALFLVIIDVKVNNVEMVLIDKMVFVIKTDAISIHLEMEIINFMDQVQVMKLIQVNLLKL